MRSAALPDYLIEKELRVAIDVERRFGFGIFPKARARAIDRRRRCVDIRHAVLGTEIEQSFRIFVVVLHKIAAIALGGIGACALMEHGFHRTVETAVVERLHECVLVDVIRDLAIGEIDELVALREVVHGNDVRHTPLIQCFDEIRSDEPGRAGYDEVHGWSG